MVAAWPPPRRVILGVEGLHPTPETLADEHQSRTDDRRRNEDCDCRVILARSRVDNRGGVRLRDRGDEGANEGDEQRCGEFDVSEQFHWFPCE